MFYERKYDVLVLLLFLACIIIHILLTNHFSSEPIESTAPEDEISISIAQYSVIYDNNIHRGVMSDYDGTTEYVYFAYSEGKSLVDVFNNQGDYLYSLQFVNQSKGTLYIRCVDDLLFVSLKNGTVLVFDGDTLIREYGKTAAREIGYDYAWFNEPSSTIALQGLYFYRVNTFNEIEKRLDISIWIALSFYERYLILVVILATVVVLTAKRFATNRDVHRNRSDRLK